MGVSPAKQMFETRNRMSSGVLNMHKINKAQKNDIQGDVVPSMPPEQRLQSYKLQILSDF